MCGKGEVVESKDAAFDYRSKTKKGVTAEMLKCLQEGEVEEWGLEWANGVLETGEWSEKEKEGEVISIYKKGGRQHITNYRGVVLVGVFGKVLESMIDKRIRKIRKHNRREREDQYAYRKNRDRTFMLLMILADIKRKIRQHGERGCEEGI
jgi:hypothetical protein